MTTLTRTWRGRLLLLLVWPVSLLLAEAGYRIWSSARGDSYDSAATLTSIRLASTAFATDRPAETGPDEDHAQAAAGDEELILHPYLAFGPSGMNESHTRAWRAFVEQERDPNEFLVLLLGGSVAAGFGDPKSAGMREFKRMLGEDPRFSERTVRVLSCAYGAHKQPQQLNQAHYLLSLGIQPHAVVNLDGFNEVALSVNNSEVGVHPIYPVRTRWAFRLGELGSDVRGLLSAVAAVENARERGLAWVERTSKWGLHRSALLGRFALGRVRAAGRAHRSASDEMQQRRTAGRHDPALKGPFHTDEREQVIETSVQIWSEGSRSLHGICAQRGIYYFHALQPTLHDEGAKPITDEEQRVGRAKDSWLYGASVGYPLLREAGARLRADGIAYHDASRVFADVAETLYYDACHFKQPGYAILGRDLGQAFLQLWPE